MRAISFILAFAVVLATHSMAGSAPDTLPGAGTFALHTAPTAVMVASR